jgi:hypothetical protein
MVGAEGRGQCPISPSTGKLHDNTSVLSLATNRIHLLSVVSFAAERSFLVAIM